MVNNILRKSWVFLPIVLVFTITGCGTLEPTRTGFLDDYSVLNKKPKKGFYTDLNPTGRTYKNIMIEPVVVYLAEDAKGANIGKGELKSLANYFYIELVNALKDDYSIVESPGPGVAKLRVAITDVMPNIPALNFQLGTKITKAGVGGAGVEVEIIDTDSGAKLMTMITRQKAPFKRLGDYGRGWERWGYTQLNFENWSKKIKMKLDKLNE